MIQGRTKERLYEEEMEVVWEKGGSGLVFYTDASHWHNLEGGLIPLWPLNASVTFSILLVFLH